MHEQFVIWATMEAKDGKDQEVRDFLVEAAQRLGPEKGTCNFYALEIGDGQFAIINLFDDEAAVQAHVGGEAAKWVMESRERLFKRDYEITRCRVLTTKQAEAAKASTS